MGVHGLGLPVLEQLGECLRVAVAVAVPADEGAGCRAVSVAGGAEFHPHTGAEWAVPVQKEVASAAGAGPRRLFFVVAVGGVHAGQFFVTDVVEAAVEVADPAERPVRAYEVSPGEGHKVPFPWSKAGDLPSVRFVTCVKR